eukprot:TRINITY_DN10417_c0_g1_i1.p1 TRINITY_DN10417_c0_g1~~TRINITY_DN10417_c0_g1_i1.p1  ORF type:complete len:343 (-),score=53.27 TRINITY_DN10417_c0_g1_i1:139-1167(-)
MKEALVDKDQQVEIINSSIPIPEADQVVIKVVVSGCNPKDWKVPFWYNNKTNSGDDIAGIVYLVGPNVYEFKVGDRVAAFHEMRKGGGSFAEYAVAWQHTTTHLPANLTFEEAATIPLAALTAVIGNYVRLKLPAPWQQASEKLPLIVYGAATAVGAFAIKLARLSNIHPIIGIAGNGISFAEGLIDKSKGDAIVDYRNGTDALLKGIKDALTAAGVSSVRHAFDAVSENGSHENLVKILADDALITNVLPIPEGFQYPKTYQETEWTMVGDVHDKQKEVGFIYFRWMFRMIQQGKFSGHPFEVVPGGLCGISSALQNLKNGKNSATKYVFRISETEGLSQK